MDFQDASLMKLQRTIPAKLVLDRKSKREAVEREYDAWQRQLRGSNEQFYSATKQQAERFKRRVKKQNHRRGLKMREYPMILRHDCVKLQQQKNSIFHWWIRIPLHPESLWIPIQEVKRETGVKENAGRGTRADKNPAP